MYSCVFDDGCLSQVSSNQSVANSASNSDCNDSGDDPLALALRSLQFSFSFLESRFFILSCPFSDKATPLC